MIIIETQLKSFNSTNLKVSWLVQGKHKVLKKIPKMKSYWLASSLFFSFTSTTRKYIGIALDQSPIYRLFFKLIP